MYRSDDTPEPDAEIYDKLDRVFKEIDSDEKSEEIIKIEII